ncbi:MAG: hypothetical protein U0103_29705 [Candidatus Obscuribacterales bacterium]
MNEQGILAAVRKNYSQYDSYIDAGTVESPELPGPGLEFQTFFIRPDKFRFQWLSWHPHFGKTKKANENGAWSNGTNFRNSYFGKTENSENLSMLVAGATGISRGSVHNILNLLIPDVIELLNPWYKMNDVRFASDDLIDGIECFHIVGNCKTPKDIEVWIDKQSLLVRRIEETMVIPKRNTAEQSNYLKMMSESMERAGLSQEVIEEAQQRAMKRTGPKTYRHIYNYPYVKVNHFINERIFTDDVGYIR